MAGTFYIPGMPVPQTPPAGGGEKAAPVDVPSSGGGGSAGGSSSDRISQITRAGDMAKRQAAEREQQRQAPVAVKTPEYKGVTPPKRLTPENESTFAKTSSNQLTWIGFMPEEQGHRVFIQTSRPTTFQRLDQGGTRVEILIQDAALAVSNNQRELDMKYFQTPFAKAWARREKKNVRVFVEFRQPVSYDVVQHDNFIDIVAKP